MVQAAQILRETPTLSEEYVNTPLGAANLPAPIMILNKKSLHGNTFLPVEAEYFLPSSFS